MAAIRETIDENERRLYPGNNDGYYSRNFSRNNFNRSSGGYQNGHARTGTNQNGTNARPNRRFQKADTGKNDSDGEEDKEKVANNTNGVKENERQENGGRFRGNNRGRGRGRGRGTSQA